MRKWISLLFLATFFVLSGCNPTISTPIPPIGISTAPAPSATIPLPPSATITPSSTVPPTLTPTRTRIPTKTNTPTVAVPDYLNPYFTELKISNWIAFNDEADLVFGDNAQILDNTFILEAENWEKGATRIAKFNEGSGVIYDFILSQNAVFETMLMYGFWGKEDYRRFGVYLSAYPSTNLYIGKNGINNYLTGNLVLIPDTWYRIIIAVGNNGDFLCVIWDPENPANYRRYRENMGKLWSNKIWYFAVNGATGQMRIKNMMDFQFEAYQ